ncbi:equilibrative nucleoside transporter 1 isoform X3 [Scophthalmus maximus]|nr:equilibrative nucleoside transporter 1 isoform X3 [Scophthalmus maximus]
MKPHEDSSLNIWKQKPLKFVQLSCLTGFSPSTVTHQLSLITCHSSVVQWNMAVSSPKDKYFGVWLIFFLLGLGTLLPWNFFMTATMYFTSRLKDPPVDSSTNQTEAAGERRSVLEAKFNNVMTLCAMLPLLICTCLNSFLHTMISQRLRVMGSLLIIMFVFIITSVLVKVPLEPLTFFSVTMVKIIVINSFGAVLQGSLFGMAGLLPASYTTPIMSGQGLAGTFAAFAMICAIASGSELHDAAFGYFITACFVIFLSLLSYMLLPKLEFFQFYRDRNRKQRRDDDNSVNLMNKDSKEETAAQSGGQNVSMMKIFKKIWLLALSVCFTFTVTIGIYPAVTADTKSTLADGDSWDLYFTPVCCFLLFNLCDWGGRSLTAVCMWPQKDSVLLPVSIMCRLLFVPLFMLCNVQPRVLLPIFFHHDGFFIVFMIFFAFSNGYLASLCMCYGPKNVLPHEAETAGTIMAFFLSLGLALGAALSFVFRALV